MPELEKIWIAGTVDVQNVFSEDINFPDQLETIEIQLIQSNFIHRTLTELQSNE